MARGRKTLEISKVELQNAINLVEINGPLDNRTSLWLAISKTEWAMKMQPRPLSPSVAMVRASALDGLVIKTPLGKRGRSVGEGMPANTSGSNTKRKKMPDDIKEILLNKTPKKYHKIVLRIVDGSLKSDIKLGCLQCTGFQREEIRNCSIKWCAHFFNRPYK